MYDCLLMNAFESYSKQTRFGIRAATSSVRQFVWSMTEQKVVSGARQLAKSFPKFMFVQYGANFVRDRSPANNIYMPTYITISQTVKYKLHGRAYSTSFDGRHFYTRCYKTIDGVELRAL
ncbi:unnamed protein product [Mucor fragilis]